MTVTAPWVDGPAVGGRGRRASVGSQVGTLARRAIIASVRSGDFVFAFFGPLIFYTCFYVPLKHTLGTHNSIDYAQYLLPVIAIQGMCFTAMSAADMAGGDAAANMSERLRAMPLKRWAPLVGRMISHAVRCIVVVLGSTVAGYIFGFRFDCGAGDFVLYLALLLVLGIALCAGADAFGSRSANPEVGGQMLLIPQLLLIMISTGISPAENFPRWIQPLVRNQPVSPIAAALRDAASGRGHENLVAAVVWCVCVVVLFGALALRTEMRRR